MYQIEIKNIFNSISFSHRSRFDMSTGNQGNMPLIIIPAVCKESGSPFGAVNVCNTKGLTYASLSMAVRQSNLRHWYN